MIFKINLQWKKENVFFKWNSFLIFSSLESLIKQIFLRKAEIAELIASNLF